MNVRPILLGLALTGCVSSSSERIIDQIEQTVHMPSGAKELKMYRRYYYRDNRAVVGTYVLSGKPGHEWRTKDKMIMVLDGGCAVVNVVFSIKDNRVTYTACNGVA